MDNLQIDLEISDDQTDVVLSKNKQKFDDWAKSVERNQPNIKFSIPNESFFDLDKIEKKAIETRRQFEQIAAARINNGQIGGLTREIVAATERSRQLSADITAIKSELSNPNRKSSISFLTDELRAAELEADRLNRKLQSVGGQSQASSIGSEASAGGSLLQNGRLRGIGPAFRATGLYQYGIDETTINAAVLGLPKITAALGTTVASLATTLGVGAIAIGAVYKITSDIRTEAEKRLKTEEDIAEAMNKQILASQDILKNAERKSYQREYDHSLDGASLPELQHKLELAQQILAIEGRGATQESADRVDQLKELIYQRGKTDNSAADKAFDANWEKFKKDQDEAAKVFAKSVDEGKKKVGELAKGWTSSIDALFQRTAGDNPFVAFIAKSQTETDKLKESLKGLPPEMQKVAFAMQAAAEGKDLFKLRLDNALGALNLRYDASNFTDPTQQERQKQLNRDVAEFVRTSNSRNPDALNEFNRRQRDILNFDSERENKRLSDVYDTIYDRRRPGFDQGIADRQFIAASAGSDPNKLTDTLRRAAADARINEAARQENAERQAETDRKEEIRVRKDFVEAVKKLTDIANEKGLAGVQQAVEVTVNDNTGGRVTARTGKRASQDNTRDYYAGPLDLVGGTNL